MARQAGRFGALRKFFRGSPTKGELNVLTLPDTAPATQKLVAIGTDGEQKLVDPPSGGDIYLHDLIIETTDTSVFVGQEIHLTVYTNSATEITTATLKSKFKGAVVPVTTVAWSDPAAGINITYTAEIKENSLKLLSIRFASDSTTTGSNDFTVKSDSHHKI